MFLVSILILVIGFVALIKGADWFVDGSSAMAKTLHVPGVIIGLTIVAFGTSAPELAVSTLAAIQGSNEIAISNVVGSNIFNLLCVLGVCSLIYPVPVEKGLLKRDYPVTIAVTVIVLLGACFKTLFSTGWVQIDMDSNVGLISRPLSIALLLLFIAYIVYLIIDAKKNPTEEDDDIDVLPLWKSVVLIIIGIMLIIGGGQAVVYAAKAIARTFGMTETLIGLTIVAVGTSLPELVTSIVAAKKGETGMAVGNVVGSNIFNMMFILGLSSLIQPIDVNMASLWDLMILVIVSIIVYIFSCTKRKIGKREGAIMLLIYLADMVFAILR